MGTKKSSAKEVTESNFRFFEETAPLYDHTDPRRREGKHGWIEGLLQRLRKESPGNLLLDAGAGTGFLAERASRHFEVTALDLSLAMLNRIHSPQVKRVQGSCEQMPFAGQTFSAVAAFATLHHLYDPTVFFREAHRVLAPGGILYTDHDIECGFLRNFGLPVRAYRSLFDHGKKYLELVPGLRARDLELTEYHGDDGLSGPDLSLALKAIGFRDVQASYHWDGMTPVSFPWQVRGFSPLLRLWAVK